MVARSARAGGSTPAEPSRVAVAADGTVATIYESSRVTVLALPEGIPFAEIGVDPEALASEVAWLGAPPRLLVLSRYGAYSTAHLLDPRGPRTIAEIRLETPMRLFATVGATALVVGALGAAALVASEAYLTAYPFPTRVVPLAAGAAAGQFVVALPASIEEWDPQSRMPKRRLRLPRAAAITAVGGSDRVVWMTTQQEPARIDVIPVVNRGQPRAHDLPEPIASIAGHPRSDLVACLGAESGRVYVIDLDGRHRMRILEPDGVDRIESVALVVGRMTGVLAAQAGRSVVIVPLDGRDEREVAAAGGVRAAELAAAAGAHHEPRPASVDEPPGDPLAAVRPLPPASDEPVPPPAAATVVLPSLPVSSSVPWVPPAMTDDAAPAAWGDEPAAASWSDEPAPAAQRPLPAPLSLLAPSAPVAGDDDAAVAARGDEPAETAAVPVSPPERSAAAMQPAMPVSLLASSAPPAVSDEPAPRVSAAAQLPTLVGPPEPFAPPAMSNEQAPPAPVAAQLPTLVGPPAPFAPPAVSDEPAPRAAATAQPSTLVSPLVPSAPPAASDEPAPRPSAAVQPTRPPAPAAAPHRAPPAPAAPPRPTGAAARSAPSTSARFSAWRDLVRQDRPLDESAARAARPAGAAARSDHRAAWRDEVVAWSRAFTAGRDRLQCPRRASDRRADRAVRSRARAPPGAGPALRRAPVRRARGRPGRGRAPARSPVERGAGPRRARRDRCGHVRRLARRAVPAGAARPRRAAAGHRRPGRRARLDRPARTRASRSPVTSR